MKATRKSFSLRLSLKLLVATSILFILTIAAVSFLSYRGIVGESKKASLYLLDANMEDIQTIIREVELSVEHEAWLVKENREDENYLYHITEKIVSESPHIVGSAIAFEKDHFNGRHYFSPYSYIDSSTGKILSKQLGRDNYDYFSMNWYTDAVSGGKPCWSEPYFDVGGGGYRMSTYSFPIKDASGHIYAVITADVTLKWLSDIIEDIHPYEHTTVSLCSNSGSYLNVADDASKVGETVYSYLEQNKGISKGMKEAVDAMMSGRRDASTYVLDSKLCYVVYGSLSNGWKLSIHTQMRDVLKHVRELNRIVILIAVLGLVLVFIFCYILVREHIRPLVIFGRNAKKIAKGDFNTDLPDLQFEDEIGQLRNSFEYMQNSLRTYISELKESTAANERFESELSIANRIQQAMLPVNFPTSDSLDLYALLKPAKEVGGDLYDFKLKGRFLYFCIGDVSGKGVPASLYMALTRMAIRMLYGNNLKENLERVNRNICESNRDFMFVTLLLGMLDCETGELTLCNAGHNPMVIVGPDGKSSFYDAHPNLALGLDSSFSYEIDRITLNKGSRLILYTDGVNEAESADSRQYGNERLLKWAASSSDRKCREAAAGLVEDIRDFAGQNPQNDDITIMTIDYLK